MPGAQDPVTLEDAVLGSLVVSADGFGDRVVWNPGPGHGLADVPDGDEARFVCVETAELTPVTSIRRESGRAVRPSWPEQFEPRQELRYVSVIGT